MKIGTYNLEFLFDAGTRLHSGKECTFTKEFVEKRFVFFAKQFDILNVDILFLQELGDESALQKILEKTKEKYSYFIAEPDKYGVGNAVIYKNSLQCECTSVPTNAPLPVFNETDKDLLGSRMWSRRDYIKLVTTYNGKPLSLLGVHVKSMFWMYKEGASFPNPTETLTQVDAADANIRSEMFRMSQVKRLRQVVDEIFAKNKEAYVAVLGDLNTAKSSLLYRIVTGQIQDRDDVLVQSIDSESVDQMLVSQQLKKYVCGGKIYDEDILTASADNVGSDHAAIVVELK